MHRAAWSDYNTSHYDRSSTEAIKSAGSKKCIVGEDFKGVAPTATAEAVSTRQAPIISEAASVALTCGVITDQLDELLASDSKLSPGQNPALGKDSAVNK